MERRWVSSPSYQMALEQLIEARKAKGLTQRDVAARLSKPPSFVAKIEVGERRIDVIEFIAMARAIGVAEMELLQNLALALPRKLEI
jgi:transcriptional regulator with XRE-family HTH domain